MAEILSGQITVATAGTAVAGTNVRGSVFHLRASPANAGTPDKIIYVGNDGSGDVTSANGYALGPGDELVVRVGNINRLMFDASADGAVVCWFKQPAG